MLKNKNNKKNPFKYKLNNYRFKKIKRGHLITTDHGSFLHLTDSEFRRLKKEDFNKNLFKKLENKGIIITDKNENQIIKDLRLRYSFLFRGTGLHIIMLTQRCNMKCSYCYISSKNLETKGTDLNKKTAKKIIDFIFQCPTKDIIIEFQGGEPLLKVNIIKFIVNYAKKINKKHNKNLNFTTNTNMESMDNDLLKYLVNEKISFGTSLDGPKSLHNHNRKSLNNKNYDTIVFWKKKLNGSKFNLQALITITKESLKYPKEIIDEYLTLGFSGIHLRFSEILGYTKDNWDKIGYTAEEFIEFWKKSLDYIIQINKKGTYFEERTIKIILHKILEKYDPEYLDLMSPCGAGIGQLFYDYKGDIFSCTSGREADPDVFKLGNVNKNTYAQVLTSKSSCAIINSSINDSYLCDMCVYKPYCGLCPAGAYAEEKTLISKIPTDRMCKINKSHFDYFFEKFLFDQKAREVFLSWHKNR